ncbi:MAG: translation elongation factor Ts [Sulfobacillus sp.]
MATISADVVRQLRERTGAGMMDCKRALEHAEGDMEAAADFLRKHGLATAAKKAGRVAAQGVVEAYVHAGGRIGVLIEVNCETDFVANTDDFRQLCHDLALQVAASSPAYVSREHVPPEVAAKEADILRAQAEQSGKPAAVIEKMVEGRIAKFYEEVCLLEQPFIRSPEMTVGTRVAETVAKTGENIQIRRFSRFAVAEGLEGAESTQG